VERAAADEEDVVGRHAAVLGGDAAALQDGQEVALHALAAHAAALVVMMGGAWGLGVGWVGLMRVGLKESESILSSAVQASSQHRTKPNRGATQHMPHRAHAPPHCDLIDLIDEHDAVLLGCTHRLPSHQLTAGDTCGECGGGD